MALGASPFKSEICKKCVCRFNCVYNDLTKEKCNGRLEWPRYAYADTALSLEMSKRAKSSSAAACMSYKGKTPFDHFREYLQKGILW